MKMIPPANIILADSTIKNAGRGVFSSATIAKDECIERCPIIFLTKEDYIFAKQTTLRNYHFL